MSPKEAPAGVTDDEIRAEVAREDATRRHATALLEALGLDYGENDEDGHETMCVDQDELDQAIRFIADAERRGAQASAAEVERLRDCLETMATFQDQRAVTARRLGAFNVANACSQFADRIRSGMPVACIVGDGVEQAMVYEDEPNSGEFILYGSPGLLQRAAESERVPTPASAKLARDVATVRFFVDVTIAGGAHPSGAPQALDRITAALGVKL